MTKEPIAVEIANKERREFGIECFKNILLKKIAIGPNTALLNLKSYFKDESEYFYCFVLISEKNGDYERNILPGSSLIPECMTTLFNAEKDCVEGNNNASIDSDIPALKVTFDDYPIVECIALNLSTLDQEEYDIAMQNYYDIASFLNSRR